MDFNTLCRLDRSLDVLYDGNCTFREQQSKSLVTLLPSPRNFHTPCRFMSLKMAHYVIVGGNGGTNNEHQSVTPASMLLELSLKQFDRTPNEVAISFGFYGVAK
ncbi:MAG: hypothetical protein HPY82_19860 [Gammaproteobacteria bacterium]|nr:hypothetical protein [Gammaproteobacteria bacterium]